MFKLFVITLLLVATYGAVVDNLDDEFADGILLETNYNLITPAEDAALVCPAGTVGNVCGDDCKTLLACITGSTTPIISNKCYDLSSSSPYCIPGKTGCSATGDASNTNCVSTSSFVCTNEGYFPDPTNCTHYHLCTEDTAQTYVCPPNYVYDSTISRCKAKRYTSDCVTINCAASANKYVVYSANKAFYAFCGVSAGVSKVIMFRCEDTANFQFNPTTISCEFVCKAEGWYPDINDCKNYYECYKSGTKLLSRVQTCPSSYIFDATQKLCVKGACATEAPATTAAETTSEAVTTISTTTGTPPL